MSRWGYKKEPQWNGGIVFFSILGTIVYLIMEHPVVFWTVFVPLMIMFVTYLVKFLRGGKLKNFGTAMLTLVAMGIALWIVCIPS